MKTADRSVVALVALLVLATTAHAQNASRMVMYTFQDGSTLLQVGFIDSPVAPRGFVLCPTSPRRQKGFRVSRQQFEQTWRTLHSSEAKKFGGSNRAFNATANYVFSVAHMPKGITASYVVPKERAPSALVSLARQMEAYAR